VKPEGGRKERLLLSPEGKDCTYSQGKESTRKGPFLLQIEEGKGKSYLFACPKGKWRSRRRRKEIVSLTLRREKGSRRGSPSRSRKRKTVGMRKKGRKMLHSPQHGRRKKGKGRRLTTIREKFPPHAFLRTQRGEEGDKTPPWL